MISRTLGLLPLIILGLLFLNSLASSEDPDSLGLQISTQAGPIQGLFENGYRVWRGVPYASASRWGIPVPPQPWISVQDTTTFGPSCPQGDKVIGITDENCLFLNIWAPPLKENTTFPVMVYIHGGAFVMGSGAVPTYHGDFFANSTGTILVTINYRLGILGFLSGNDGFTGNYGFRDQQAALVWVQKNIAAFNGDPQQVTIFGQSAGGMSVFYHLAAPGSNGLFQKAIVESNPTGVLLRTLEENRAYFDILREVLKCPIFHSEECFYNKTVEELLDAQKYTFDFRMPLFHWADDILSWLPTIDGDVIPGQPLELIKAGNYSKVPIIMGTTVNETSSWTFNPVVIPNFKFSVWEYKLLLDIGFDNKTQSRQAFELYPAEKDGVDVRIALAQLTTDLAFTCPSLTAVSHMSDSNPNPVYSYVLEYSARYDPENPFPACWHLSPDNGGLGYVCHASELPFVFHSGAFVNDIMSVAELNYSEQLLSYWTSFANGTFDDVGLPAWQPFVSSSGNSQGLGIPINQVTNFRQDKCDFWNSLDFY